MDEWESGRGEGPGTVELKVTEGRPEEFRCRVVKGRADGGNSQARRKDVESKLNARNRAEFMELGCGLAGKRASVRIRRAEPVEGTGN